MTKAIDVTHKKWNNTKVLFDDGNFSAIIGKYDGSSYFSIAVRWNGEGDDPGYPKLFKKPVWFNIPDYLAIGMVHTLQLRHIEAHSLDDNYLSNTRFALHVLQAQKQGLSVTKFS
ncbi:hypothetical protein BN7874_038 [Phage NCTB]|nr:hypothetical protein BN7874_038 [Phage NCTB]